MTLYPRPDPPAPSERRLRILMVAACPFPTSQGTQVFIGQLADALSAAGHRVDLLTYGLGLGDIGRHDLGASYSVHRGGRVPGHTKLGAGPSWGRPLADGLLVLKGLSLLRGAARCGDPVDLVHAHNYEGALVGAALCARRGLPLLYHAHNLMGDELETYFDSQLARGLARRFGKLLDVGVPSLADAMVSVSSPTCDRLRELTKNVELIEYHPPAVSFEPSAGVAEDPSKPLVYCGNLDGYQDIETMFGALAQLEPGVGLTLITPDPPARTASFLAPLSLKQRVEVVPHGSFENVKRHLQGAKIALLPRSVRSGFPIKLINYLAAGLPVVACRGGAQTLDQQSGVVVVPDRDSAAMADAITELLSNAPRRIELSSRAKSAAAAFTWPEHIRSLDRFYAQLLEKHGVGDFGKE